MNTQKLLLIIICSLVLPATIYAQPSSTEGRTSSPTGAGQSPSGGAVKAEGGSSEIITFRFVAGKDMFYVPWGGNDAELNRLYSLVDEYRTEITSGRMPVYVDGYCASLPTAQENLRTAAVRSNRVKSELITDKGLVEDNFITKNHASAYTGADGVSRRDMVVVTLRIPAKEEPRQPEPVREETPTMVREEPRREEPPVVVQQPESEPVVEPQTEPEQVADALAGLLVDPIVPAKPYCFAIRTNLLYDAFLLPTLGVEWRASRSVGVKLDIGGSYWGDEHGKVQKMWLVSPEVRWYLLQNKRLYVGAAGNIGEANIYKGMLGCLISKDTGYQGSFWNAGLSLGYQLRLSRSFSLDFNLGLGYTRFEYDTFGIIDGVRVSKGKSLTKELWGPTQAGISLVWTLGK